MKALVLGKTTDVFPNTTVFKAAYNTNKANHDGQDSILSLQLITTCPEIHMSNVFSNRIVSFTDSVTIRDTQLRKVKLSI